MKRLAPAVCALVLVAGCGGGGSDKDRFNLTTPKAATPERTPTPDERPASGDPVTEAEKRIIRGWSDALRHGDVDKAVSYWAVPSIAANGNQPVRLLTRRAVRAWNESLPCGAKLVSVKRDANYVLATFKLTNRRGVPQGCGVGVGNRARTAFLLRDGKIAQWIRAPGPDDPAPGVDPSSTPS